MDKWTSDLFSAYTKFHSNSEKICFNSSFNCPITSCILEIGFVQFVITSRSIFATGNFNFNPQPLITFCKQDLYSGNDTVQFSAATQQLPFKLIRLFYAFYTLTKGPLLTSLYPVSACLIICNFLDYVATNLFANHVQRIAVYVFFKLDLQIWAHEIKPIFFSEIVLRNFIGLKFSFLRPTMQNYINAARTINTWICFRAK